MDEDLALLVFDLMTSVGLDAAEPAEYLATIGVLPPDWLAVFVSASSLQQAAIAGTGGITVSGAAGLVARSNATALATGWGGQTAGTAAGVWLEAMALDRSTPGGLRIRGVRAVAVVSRGGAFVGGAAGTTVRRGRVLPRRDDEEAIALLMAA